MLRTPKGKYGGPKKGIKGIGGPGGRKGKGVIYNPHPEKPDVEIKPTKVKIDFTKGKRPTKKKEHHGRG